MQQNSVKNVYFYLTIYNTAKLCQKFHIERVKIFKIPQTPTLCSIIIVVNLAGVMPVCCPCLYFFFTRWAFFNLAGVMRVRSPCPRRKSWAGHQDHSVEQQAWKSWKLKVKIERRKRELKVKVDSDSESWKWIERRKWELKVKVQIEKWKLTVTVKF